MSSKLQAALRAKYNSPQAALRALGLDPAILDGPRLACDEAEKANFKQLLLSLRAKRFGTAATPADRWPEWDRITKL